MTTSNKFFKLMLFLQLYAIGYWFYLDFLFTDKDTLDVYCNGEETDSMVSFFVNNAKLM
jgi:hypothetical protein